MKKRLEEEAMTPKPEPQVELQEDLAQPAQIVPAMPPAPAPTAPPVPAPAIR